MRLTRIDQITERALDGVERAEPQRPSAQQCHQVRRNGPPKREALVELPWIEDGLDALFIDVVGAVALDRIRHEVRCELDHPRPRVVASLLVEVHGEPLRGLEQCRHEETDGARAEDVNSDGVSEVVRWSAAAFVPRSGLNALTVDHQEAPTGLGCFWPRRRLHSARAERTKDNIPVAPSAMFVQTQKKAPLGWHWRSGRRQVPPLHVEDRDARRKDRPEQHDDQPPSALGEHQRPAKPDGQDEQPPKAETVPGSIPRATSSAQCNEKRRIESRDEMVSVT